MGQKTKTINCGTYGNLRLTKKQLLLSSLSLVTIFFGEGIKFVFVIRTVIKVKAEVLDEFHSFVSIFIPTPLQYISSPFYIIFGLNPFIITSFLHKTILPEF